MDELLMLTKTLVQRNPMMTTGELARILWRSFGSAVDKQVITEFVAEVRKLYGTSHYRPFKEVPRARKRGPRFSRLLRKYA